MQRPTYRVIGNRLHGSGGYERQATTTVAANPEATTAATSIPRGRQGFPSTHSTGVAGADKTEAKEDAARMKAEHPTG